jgi:4-hydroxy-tetrahydrodipicolinate reductase
VSGNGTKARLPVAIAGASGRMGGLVAAAVERAEDLALVARPGRGGLDEAWNGAKVVADFTAPEATARVAGLAAERGTGVLVGTTGLDAAAERALESAAGRVPVLVAPNLSLGVLALARALRVALRTLPDYDVEIVERHHGKKADAPSGTALFLASIAAQERGLDPSRAMRAGRSGRVGPRTAGEIGIHAVRGGGWIGSHTVHLAGPHESLELAHTAQSREAFAEGALHALRFLAQAPPGRYGLEDALT